MDNFLYFGPNKILILGKVGFQSDQIPAASWSGNTCPPSNQLIITLIRLLFGEQGKTGKNGTHGNENLATNFW